MPRIWVVAACEGAVALFEKEHRGASALVARGECPVFSSFDAFRAAIREGLEARIFDQLVMVGSSGDLAWVHSLLPEDAASRIVAEINYPLLPVWFREMPSLPQLAKALQGVLEPV